MRRCETEAEALRRGNAMLKRIKAKGCTLRVHENIGRVVNELDAITRKAEKAVK